MSKIETTDVGGVLIPRQRGRSRRAAGGQATIPAPAPGPSPAPARPHAEPADEAAAATVAPTVSVVIPALNEARNLPHVAARMPEGMHEIIVIDGNSIDDTVAVAKELWPQATILSQTRRGKGNALACGFAQATGDIIVMIDADGSTDPGEILDFVAALTAGADFAKGTRFAHGGGSSDITPTRRAGNWFLNALVNVLFKTRYTDLCYGYNAFWRHCVATMNLPDIAIAERQWGDGFEIETLINVRVATAGMRIREVPSFERERIHGVSNLHPVKDGLRVLKTIRQERRSMRSAGRPARRLRFS
jgi:glycosyltransferase involved in cell wall biosynthesis